MAFLERRRSCDRRRYDDFNLRNPYIGIYGGHRNSFHPSRRPPLISSRRESSSFYFRDRTHHRKTTIHRKWRRSWPFRSPQSRAWADSYVFSRSRLAQHEIKHQSLGTEPSKNSSFTFKTQNKALSFFVEKVTNATTSTTSSLRRSTTPFTAPQVSDPPMKLLCDTPSVHPPPIHSQSTAVETETPGLQSQTGEGDLSEENPSLGRVEDRGLDLEASGNNPLNPGFNSNLARFYEVIRDDDNPKEADIHHKADMGKQIEPFQGLQPYTILYPPLQRSSLSPLATEFIPTTPNSFAVLFNPGHASETSLDPIPLEDPLVNLYERNMALYNNAIEDLPHERDEPLLYTHSDGEDKVFIDYKLKPLQIDTSRCSKTPLLLGRVFKGRKTYSPSQVVTRSKARLLAEGRKKSPLGWFEDPDEPANTFANEIIQAFKQSCPVKKEVTPKQPLTRSQKKKAKKKLKLAKVVEQNWDDYEDDYL